MRKQPEPACQEQADVVVVGGGPAGSATALRLARHGLHVVQLERRSFGAPENDRLRSGEGALPSTLRALRRLTAVSIDESCLLATARGVRIRWPDGRVTVDRFPGDRVIRIVDREALDLELWRAAGDAGVDGREGWSVRQIDTQGERVLGVVAHTREGEPVAIHAPLVVDAGGRNAPSLTQLGLRLPEIRNDFVVIVLFFDMVPGIDPELPEMHMIGGSAPAVVQGGWLTDGVIRFGLGTNMRLKLGSRTSPEEFFWRVLRGYPELEARLRHGRIIRRPYVRAGLSFRTRHLARPGLLIVGDAAGYLNPILGDGILMALRSAELASRIAMTAFARGDFSLPQLLPYERRWRSMRFTRVWIGRALIEAHRQPTLINSLGRLAPLRQLLLHRLLANG